MPPTEDAEARSGGTLAYLLAYVAWLVSGAGIFYALIRWREALLTAYPALGLPKNALGRKMLKKLKVYAGEDHPHAAQHPKPWMTS